MNYASESRTQTIANSMKQAAPILRAEKAIEKAIAEGKFTAFVAGPFKQEERDYIATLGYGAYYNGRDNGLILSW